MLKIKIPESEQFNNSTGEFVTFKAQELTLEHSLLSVAKWEAKWHKPFLSKKGKTREEMLSYIECMIINGNVDPNVLYFIPIEEYEKIENYLKDPMTATEIYHMGPKKTSKRTVTAELVYCWMIQLNMDVEVFQKWHFNRLMTLIETCQVETAPKKNMPKNAVLKHNSAVNAARRAAANSRG